MKNLLLIGIILFSIDLMKVEGQIIAMDWHREMQSTTGHVNVGNGGITGDIAIQPNLNSVVVIGNNASGSPLFFSPIDSIIDGMFICSYSATGSLQWVRNYGKGNLPVPRKVCVDEESNIYVLGDFTNMEYGEDTLTSGWATDMFISKHDQLGNILWIKQMGSAINNNFGYDDTSVEMQLADGNIFIILESHNTFTYDGEIVTDVNGGQSNVLLKLDLDGNLLSHATVETLDRPQLAITGNGGIITYSNEQVNTINGESQYTLPDPTIHGQLIIFNGDLDLERTVNLNLNPSTICNFNDGVLLGGTIPAWFDSVLVDSMAVYGFNDFESRWLMLWFEENGDFNWVSDYNPFSNPPIDPMVVTTDEEILALDGQGEMATYSQSGVHINTQVLTTGALSFRALEFASGSLYLYSNFTGTVSILGEAAISTNENTDCFVSKLKYSPLYIPVHSNKREMIVLPNPTTSTTTLTWQGKNQGNYQLKLYDVRGREVSPSISKEEEKWEIDMSGLAPGIYFGRLVVGPFERLRVTDLGISFKVVRE